METLFFTIAIVFITGVVIYFLSQKKKISLPKFGKKEEGQELPAIRPEQTPVMPPQMAIDSPEKPEPPLVVPKPQPIPKPEPMPVPEPISEPELTPEPGPPAQSSGDISTESPSDIQADKETDPLQSEGFGEKSEKPSPEENI